MAVFGGREGPYASDLPMLHAPHDSQIVLRLHLAGVAAVHALRQELAVRPRLPFRPSQTTPALTS